MRVSEVLDGETVLNCMRMSEDYGGVSEKYNKSIGGTRCAVGLFENVCRIQLSVRGI